MVERVIMLLIYGIRSPQMPWLHCLDGCGVCAAVGVEGEATGRGATPALEPLPGLSLKRSPSARHIFGEKKKRINKIEKKYKVNETRLLVGQRKEKVRSRGYIYTRSFAQLARCIEFPVPGGL